MPSFDEWEDEDTFVAATTPPPTMDTSSSTVKRHSSLEAVEEDVCEDEETKPFVPTSTPGRQMTPQLEAESLPYSASAPTQFELPENFSMVAPGVFRSGFPKKKNFAFLRHLGIRSILFLAPEDYPDGSLAFMAAHGIELLQHGVSGNKEPFVEINVDVMKAAVISTLDVRNHPVLIHCNKGKHRTGCLVGCVRKTMRWCITSIFNEYRRFAGTKARRADQEFIELFDTRDALAEINMEYKPKWLDV